MNFRPAALASCTALALALGGCASLTARQAVLPEVAVPAQWSASAPPGTPALQATSLAQWWQRFDDPLLSQLVTQALQANTSVRSAQAALAQARALRDVQSAQLGPNLGASASAQRSKSGDNAAVNTYRTGFDASWEPDVFGGQRAGVSAADADAQASQASLADTQVSVAAEVAVAYLQLRGSQARLAIARRNLEAQQETLQITDWRVQAGLTTSLELSQARTATEQTRAQIPVLETSVAQTQHALAVLTGQPPTALQAQLDPAAAVPQPPADLALSIPAQTLRQRPDVRIAEQQISAALARVSQADAARYPSFQISGSVGLSALALSSLTGGGSVVSALLGSVSVPLFDGGAARAQVRSQEAALEKARVTYQAVVLNALQEVEDALVALRGDRERLARLQSASDAAERAALLATQRYKSGLVDFQTVLETQRSLLSTQDSVASTQAELSADHVRLYKALGGGWAPDTEGTRS
ncbi:MAG: efflux transporter outer membrane subunit [Rhizobacter sp.]|nr:efflux transporter outer membrane subunit [Rhizobacter sp.]